MNTNYLHKIYSYLLSYISIQLYITLWSLPILIAWGIPFCPLSFVGNLLFSPFLILFLILSSLIFFSHIIYVPNDVLITSLEWLCAGWKHILHAAPLQSTWGCSQPYSFFLIALPILSLVICSSKLKMTKLQQTGALLLLLIIHMLLLPYLHTPKKCIETIASPYGPIHMIYTNNHVTIIDPGSLGSRHSSESWVEYTLLPLITQKTSKTEIDTFICLRPTCITFKMLAGTCKKTIIKNIYLPFWDGKIPLSAFKSFTELKQKTHLIRFGKDKKIIPLSSTEYLVIESLNKKHQLSGYSVPSFCITGQIDKKEITIYDSKTKKEKC